MLVLYCFTTIMSTGTHCLFLNVVTSMMHAVIINLYSMFRNLQCHSFSHLYYAILYFVITHLHLLISLNVLVTQYLLMHLIGSC